MGRKKPIDQMSFAEWREVMTVILDAAFHGVHACLPELKKSGSGAIVNIGGMSAHTGSQHRAHVIAAKAGLVGLTRALAHDLASDGITVNCVVPGLIATQRGGAAGNTEPAHHAERKTLLGRRGMPEEVANLVAFLCSDKARYLTGQVIHANGGAFLG